MKNPYIDEESKSKTHMRNRMFELEVDRSIFYRVKETKKAATLRVREIEERETRRIKERKKIERDR